MLVEQVLQGVVAQGGSGVVGKAGSRGLALAFSQPIAQHDDGVFAQGRAAALAALALASHVRAGAEHDVLAAKTDEFGGAQSGLDGQHQQRPIAPPRPGGEVGRGEQRVDFERREKVDRTPQSSACSAWPARAAPRRCAPVRAGPRSGRRNGSRPGARCDCGRCSRGRARDDPRNAPSSGVSRSGTVRFEGALPRRCCAYWQQQAKGVAVARDGVRTRLPLPHEPIHEERLHAASGVY